MCVKTLFVTVTILSPNVLLNDSSSKSIVDTRKITENFHTTKVTFLSVDFFLFKYMNTWHYLLYLRRHVNVKTSLALPYMAISSQVYTVQCSVALWEHYGEDYANLYVHDAILV